MKIKGTLLILLHRKKDCVRGTQIHRENSVYEYKIKILSEFTNTTNLKHICLNQL
jgi:hypothetical protein